ncbi:MAG: hypothetical protein RIG84_15470 [Roseovarius sp.]
MAAEFGNHLSETCLKVFSDESTRHADLLKRTAAEALGHLRTCDAPYHDAEHTMIVTLVGQQILLGQLKTGVVTPDDWVHVIVALLLHDIGFARGVCEGDTFNEVVINEAGERVCPARGATDACLGPYHVDRSKLFARQRFAGSEIIDAERLAAAIEYTRFPVPDDPAYAAHASEPGLVRAADLIGQIADPYYFRKISGLYHEFAETGFTEKLGLCSPMDLVDLFPRFFHDQVEGLIGPALEHLRRTEEGRELIERLYERVTQISRRENTLGPFSGPPSRP